MSANSDEILQQVRAEFEDLLGSVINPVGETAPTADVMERSLLRVLLNLGRSMMRLYFVHQAHKHAPESVQDAQGKSLPYHAEKMRSYFSVFGKVCFARRYYYRNGRGVFPLDAALNLPAKGTSDLVREWRQRISVYDPYNKVGEILSELLGPRFSTRALAEDVAEDACLVEDYYEQTEPPQPDNAAKILVVQADGKGVPMVVSSPEAPAVRLGKGQKTGHKKEAVVSGVYTIAACVRTPQAVVESLFEKTPGKPERPARSRPHNKRLWATLEGKDAALQFAHKQVQQQEGAHIEHRVALTDGAEALQQRVEKAFPAFTLVLDIIHAIEYLWKAANALLGENAPERTAWVKARALQMLQGEADALIADLRDLSQEPTCKAEAKRTLLKVAGYYERNRAYMHYDQYLSRGWPIATGVIEGACGHLVKDRCELSGMRWSQAGAEALLHLRCVAENGDWVAFHAYRRDQRHRTLYGNRGFALHDRAAPELSLAA